MVDMNALPEFDRTVAPVMEAAVTRGRIMRLNAGAYHWLRERAGLHGAQPLHIAIRGTSSDPDIIGILYDPDGLKVDPGNYTCSGVGLARDAGLEGITFHLPLAPAPAGMPTALIGRKSAIVRRQAGGESAGAPRNGSRAVADEASTTPEASGPPAPPPDLALYQNPMSGEVICTACGEVMADAKAAVEHLRGHVDRQPDEPEEWLGPVRR